MGMEALAASHRPALSSARLSATGGGSTLPTKIGDALVARLGRAAFPVAIVAGAAALGTAGFFMLGPVGGAIGAVLGGWAGALCVGLRP